MLEIGGKRGSTERSGQRLDAMGGNDARVDVGAAIVETVPNVRQTAIVTPKLSNNVNATRPTLVNDIVIISEAPESPTANRTIPISRSSASGNNMPSIWPVAGAIRGGFGVRHNPFGGPGSEFHKGQDISAAYGSQVIATADGVVVIAGWLRGYGNVVYVDHGNGISTRYGHLSHIDVTVGQTVKRGDNLGLVGSTGRSTGPHLHYEVRIDGQATNPIPYLPNIPEQPVTTSPANR
jgi:murein DD-endopeptidase MepM/ murein hydrolase activator NlpD